MKWSIDAKTLLAGAITLAMLSVIGLISLKQAQQSRNIAEWVSHSHSIINNLNACRRLADTADNQARGYTETGDSEFLSGYRAHSTELIAQCGVLAELVSDNPQQTERIHKLTDFCKDEIRVCDELIRAYKTSPGDVKAKRAETVGVLKKIEDQSAETEAEEKHLLAQRSLDFLKSSDNILLGQGLLLGLSVIVLVTALLLARRHFQQQQRSQELLKASKLQFTGIFNQAFQQVWILSIDGNLLQANQTALDFVGLTRETEVGRPFWETAWWRDQAANQSRFKTALAAAIKGNVDRFELEATSASGRFVLLDFSLKPLLDERGKVRLIMAEGRDITQIKIAQTELKENQIRLDAIVQSLAEGLFQLDTNARVVVVNPVGAKMLGYESDELTGEVMHDIVHVVEHPENNCPIFQVIKHGEMQNHDDMFRRKDGSVFPVHLLSAPLIVDGQIRGAVVSFYDITVRKEAQARANMQYALTNMLSQADSLASAAPKLLKQVCDQISWDAGVFWLVDKNSKSINLVSSWHNSALTLPQGSGLFSKKELQAGEDLPGRVWQQNGPLWVGKGSQSESAFFAEAVKSGLNNVFAFPVRSDEEVLGVICLLSKSSDEPTSTQLQMLNAIASQFGQFIERQQAEDELRDKEMLFQQLVTNIREIFWISSARPGENKVLYVSPAYEEVWGRPVSEVYERANSYFDAIVPEDRDRVRQHVMKDMYSGSAIEYRIIRPDGSLRWVWGRWTPVMDADGKPERLVGIVHDISERKEIERRVSEFYSTVSHELRTPLTSIRASLGLMEGGIAGELPPKATKLVDIARSECDRLIRLINDILDIRKIEAGKLELKLKPVEPRKMVELTMQNTAGMASEHNITLTPQIETVRETRADQDRLIQVLTNLVSNAIKFAPDDSEVTIAAQDNGRFCRFSVTDKGPGIPEDQLPKLFGLFQQLDSTDSRPKGGTGLGLAISKAIVEQHGGTINVTSVPGEGSTFFFDIPASADSTPVQEAPAPSADATSGNGPVLLIVEDDSSTRQILVHQLNEVGLKAIEASSGDAALQAVREHKPDLIILDLGLPGFDGFELVKKLEDSEFKSTPLLVYTSRDLANSDIDKLKLGPSRHLVKSKTSQAEFLDAVRQLLGSGVSRR